MTSHGLGNVLGLDVAKADLNGVVAVGRLSFNLRDGTGASLDDRDGNDVVVLVPNLGHANLAAENHVDHVRSPTLGVLGHCEHPLCSPLEDHYQLRCTPVCIRLPALYHATLMWLKLADRILPQRAQLD